MGIQNDINKKNRELMGEDIADASVKTGSAIIKIAKKGLKCAKMD